MPSGYAGTVFGRRMQEIEPNEKPKTTGNDQETDDPQYKRVVLKPYHAVAEQIKPSITKRPRSHEKHCTKGLSQTKRGTNAKPAK